MPPRQRGPYIYDTDDSRIRTRLQSMACVLPRGLTPRNPTRRPPHAIAARHQHAMRQRPTTQDTSQELSGRSQESSWRLHRLSLADAAALLSQCRFWVGDVRHSYPPAIPNSCSVLYISIFTHRSLPRTRRRSACPRIPRPILAAARSRWRTRRRRSTLERRRTASGGSAAADLRRAGRSR